MTCFSIGVLLISQFWIGPTGKDLSSQDYARGGTPSTSVGAGGAGTALVGITLEGTTGEGEERFVPHGIRHLKFSKRKILIRSPDQAQLSGVVFAKITIKISDSAVSFNCSTVVSNPDDCISNCVS